MTDLFDKDAKESADNISDKNIPLAEKLRPKILDEVIGQDKTLASDGQLKSMVKSGQLSSIIFWGPPGVGKTTLARVIANEVSAHYEEISAIFSGVSDLKKLQKSFNKSVCSLYLFCASILTIASKCFLLNIVLTFH